LRLGDAQIRAGGQLTQLTRQSSADPRAFQRGGSELSVEFWSDPHQMPAQPVDQLDSLVYQLIAVATQHADLVRLLV
jgi:hypothetical protein